MALITKSNPGNTTGSLYVDMSCIDCGTCFHLAPDIFKEVADRSLVDSQPLTPEEWTRSKMALISCPTNSIGVVDAPIEFKEAKISLPHLIAENIYYCGYTSKDSFGASSYLITHPKGNILIDCPRFHPTLIKELEELGGIKTILLTHKDDVADHELFAVHFNCERIIHEAEVTNSTREVERQISATKAEIVLPDLLMIPTPGHTQGHMVFLYKNKYLFTGDHLFYSSQENKLTASRNVCWYSWEKQVQSMELLLEYNFQWILPGHGGWGYKLESEMKSSLANLIKEMKT